LEVDVEILAAICGTALIVVVLWEGFETIILPRRVTRRFRTTRLFYRSTWVPWANTVKSLVPARRQESWLSIFGPLSLILLLSIWASGLITGFALLHWALGSAVIPKDGGAGFLTDLYMSGTTFFTLGIGDVVPGNAMARVLVVAESGMGFGFLAMVFSYLPALNQFFARREVNISLLDARAGSPPTASEMLSRHGHERGLDALRTLLHEWERWSAELLEAHLSYPVLAYFRSQHDNQSWLGALTAILDTCTLIMAGVEGACKRQAELTFAMARHALVDLTLVFHTRPHETKHNRLPPEKLEELRGLLTAAGIKISDDDIQPRLTELRHLYEPQIVALASYFRVRIPPWIAEEKWLDNWQANILERRSINRGQTGKHKVEHF
jgi:hypothetical protein